MADAPAAVRDGIQRVVDDYETGSSLEVEVAHDADKLDCLFQAIEYREQGNQNTQQFIDSMLAAITTRSAQQTAQAALGRGSQNWHATQLGRRDRGE